MDIIQTLDTIVKDQLNEQKLRKESIERKKQEITKHKNCIKKIEERIVGIEEEAKNVSTQISEVLEIKKQLTDACLTSKELK